MEGEIFILMLSDDKAYLIEEKPLTIAQLGLSDTVKAFKNICWQIRVLKYFPTERKIFAEILSYDFDPYNFYYTQQLNYLPQLREIQSIAFRSIDTSGLLQSTKIIPHIVSYIGASQNLNVSIDDDKNLLAGKKQDVNKLMADQGLLFNVEPAQKEPVIIVIKKFFLIPIKDLRFQSGGVKCNVLVTDINKAIEITVVNYNIREEFDAVKNYFANVLGTKKIQITATIEITDGIPTKVEAHSPEIDHIDDRLIETVKFDFLKDTIKKRIKVETEKTFLTMEEFFDTLSEKTVKASAFYDTDQNLADDILKITETKHYKNLRFLSSRHAKDIMKLRFILKPFSYIFLIEGTNNYYIVWETLDTQEATYVWSVDKDLKKLKLALKKVEDIINNIRVQGKTAYINSSEDEYRRIFHNYKEDIEGFVKWKGELESILN